MSRRTERPYQVDGADKLAPHSAVRCSAPEINGPVVQREFPFLLRETCGFAPPETARTVVSNGHWRTAGVSRGRSTESNEPGIRTMQDLLGHVDVATTQIYTQVMARPGLGVRSPLDA